MYVSVDCVLLYWWWNEYRKFHSQFNKNKSLEKNNLLVFHSSFQFQQPNSAEVIRYIKMEWKNLKKGKSHFNFPHFPLRYLHLGIFKKQNHFRKFVKISLIKTFYICLSECLPRSCLHFLISIQFFLCTFNLD